MLSRRLTSDLWFWRWFWEWEHRWVRFRLREGWGKSRPSSLDKENVTSDKLGEVSLAQIQTPHYQRQYTDKSQIALLIFVLLWKFKQWFTQTFRRRSFLFGSLASDLNERQYEDSRNIEGFALQPLQIRFGHAVGIVAAAALQQSIASWQHDLGLISTLPWPYVVCPTAVHEQCGRYFRNVIQFIRQMCPNYISDDEPKECAIDGVHEVVSGDVGTFASVVQYALELVR